MNMENLNETIKRILLNIQYDNNMTLKENFDGIDLLEQRVGAQTLADLRTALGELKDVKSIFNLAMAESKILKLIEMDAKNFAKEVEKAARADLKSGVPAGTIGPQLKELSKLDTIRRITDETSRLNRTLTTAEIESLKNAARAESLGVLSKVKVNPPKPPKPNPINPTPPIPPPPPKPTWNRFKSWVGYAGLAVVGGAAALAVWNWLSGKGNDDELLKAAKKCGYDSIEEFEAANFKCPKGGTIPPPPPIRNQFKNCEGKDFLTLYCKSSDIKTVQRCLGVKVDGAWGPDTQTAIVANAPRFSSGFYLEDIDEICNLSKQNSNNKSSNDGRIVDIENLDSVEVSTPNTINNTNSGVQDMS